jgi:hypothetical protein
MEPTRSRPGFQARRRSQLLMAELTWSVVGSGLLTLGLYWVLRHFGLTGLEYAAPAAALGVGKSLLVLDRVARGAVGRIAGRNEPSFALGFFSVRGWLLIAGMMLMGQLLRLSPIPRYDLGFLYVAIGAALLTSSRLLWQAWWRRRPAATA